jgi:hypothetical protein
MKAMKFYLSPILEIISVEAERGFSLSGGSTIEQIGGRLEEESWE